MEVVIHNIEKATKILTRLTWKCLWSKNKPWPTSRHYQLRTFYAIWSFLLLGFEAYLVNKSCPTNNICFPPTKTCKYCALPIMAPICIIHFLIQLSWSHERIKKYIRYMWNLWNQVQCCLHIHWTRDIGTFFSILWSVPKGRGSMQL